MVYNLILLVKPKVKLPLDNSFRPGVLWNRAFIDAVRLSKKDVPLVIGLERRDGSVSVFKTQVFPSGYKLSSANLLYAERIVKTLLWLRGGYKVIVGGPKEIGEHIEKVYSSKGERAFDVGIMSAVYEKPFVVKITNAEKVPLVQEKSSSLGRHLNGCRIGFDLGASDRKISAVINGKAVFSEEVVWNPRDKTDPQYHYHEIMSALHCAAACMPRVDAIGGSAAGIYINNRVMIASLFRGVPHNIFKKKVKNIFLKMKKEWNVPFDVVNDGDVTALAGSMSLNVNSILGIALGSSEAGGYINKNGDITGWLNELAFAPVDFNPDAPVDEWSDDRGCGVQYFSQVAVIRLAKIAGITLDEKQTPAEKLKTIQGLMAKGDERVKKIFETIGCYMGYGVAYYADFYDLKHILILGRVTSGEGGQIILQKAQEVLNLEFPELSKKIMFHLPDESSRRVGQSIAAASLPVVKGRK